MGSYGVGKTPLLRSIHLFHAPRPGVANSACRGQLVRRVDYVGSTWARAGVREGKGRPPPPAFQHQMIVRADFSTKLTSRRLGTLDKPPPPPPATDMGPGTRYRVPAAPESPTEGPRCSYSACRWRPVAIGVKSPRRNVNTSRHCNPRTRQGGGRDPREAWLRRRTRRSGCYRYIWHTHPVQLPGSVGPLFVQVCHAAGRDARHAMSALPPISESGKLSTAGQTNRGRRRRPWRVFVQRPQRCSFPRGPSLLSS